MDGDSREARPGYHYPFAAAPDISKYGFDYDLTSVRSTQKDAYFQKELFEHFENIIRRLYGVRFLHNWENEAKVAADFLYLGLTTLLGNRTLGEEYCDIVQVETSDMKLPQLRRRAGYILTTILLPYTLTRTLPSIRRRLRQKLERSLQPAVQKKTPASVRHLQSYLLDNLDTLTSPAPLYAVSLAFFYFSGAYYQLGKRIWGLRYVFTKKLGPGEARVGYEVLGVLLVAQMAIQAWSHANKTWQNGSLPLLSAYGGGALVEGGVEMEFDPEAFAENDGLTFLTTPPSSDHRSSHLLTKLTHTPDNDGKPLFVLGPENDTMKWVESSFSRNCTLCLEEMKDPSVTTCGHLFCWSCIYKACIDKPECPLCRQTSLPQHILPLRG